MSRSSRLVIFLLLLTGTLSSCLNDLKKVDEIASQKDIGNEIGVNVEVDEMEEGYLRVKIQAPETIRHTQGENTTEFPKGIKAYTYDESGNIESSMSARYATLNEEQGQIQGMKAKNDVVVVNVKGERLNTEELNWDAKEKKIWSDAFVKIRTQDEIIYGRGFTSNEDFSEYTIRKITGTISVKEADMQSDTTTIQ